MLLKTILLTLIIILSLASCKEESSYLPKPRIYPKVNYPVKEYKVFNLTTCPFTMSIPEYFNVIEDGLKTEQEKVHQCWYDLYCEELNSYIHLSYLPFKGRKAFDKLVRDAFEMVDKHNIKASYRDELRIDLPEKKVHGLLFDIDGPVATPLQFFLTDSTQHFLRGSLYFKAEVNRDSIAPVYDFLKEDIEKMIGSFEFE